MILLILRLNHWGENIEMFGNINKQIFSLIISKLFLPPVIKFAKQLFFISPPAFTPCSLLIWFLLSTYHKTHQEAASHDQGDGHFPFCTLKLSGPSDPIANNFPDPSHYSCSSSLSLTRPVKGTVPLHSIFSPYLSYAMRGAKGLA